MRVLAALFRIFSLVGLLALCGLLWLKFDTQTKQQTAFLDDVLDDAYGILQSDSKLWDEVKEADAAFDDAYSSNLPLEFGKDNPLELAVERLNEAGKSIFIKGDYRDILDNKTKEYGPGTLEWNTEENEWFVPNGIKLNSPSNFKDPFEDLSQFPFKDEKQEDGTVIKGVSRHHRLRTVIGMFYRERHNLYTKELPELRKKLFERDNLFRDEQRRLTELREKHKQLEDEMTDALSKLDGLTQDIKAKDAKINELDDAVTKGKEDADKRWNDLKDLKDDEIAKLQIKLNEETDNNKVEMAALRKEMNQKIEEAYQDGKEDMVKMQRGTENEEDKMSEEVNPFMVKKNDSGPPAMNELDLMAVSQQKQISEIGAPSTISRVDSDSGMMLLPFGMERGVEQGTVFTVWKDKREAARIRVQSSRDGFLLAYILPRFGEPQKLRPGDSIYIIPEKEQEL